MFLDQANHLSQHRWAAVSGWLSDSTLGPAVSRGTDRASAGRESHKGHGQKAQHDHKTHEVDLAPFMIRNAYHFATLYHAARAERWELAAYQAEELEENLTQARVLVAPMPSPSRTFSRSKCSHYARPLPARIRRSFALPFRPLRKAATTAIRPPSTHLLPSPRSHQYCRFLSSRRAGR